MAVPTFVSAGTIATDLTGAASTTPTPPTHVADDILLAMSYNEAGTVMTTATSGWNKIDETDGTVNTAWFWKRATGAGTAGPTITASNTDQFAICYVIRGCITTGNPYEAGFAKENSSDATDTTPNNSVITTIGDDRFVMSFMSRGSSEAVSSGLPPGGWTSNDNQSSASGTTVRMIGISQSQVRPVVTTQIVIATFATAIRYGTLTLAFIPPSSQFQLLHLANPITEQPYFQKLRSVSSGFKVLHPTSTRVEFMITDSDAANFITQAGLTASIDKYAAQFIIQRAKANGWWTPSNAIYPVIGGVQASHAINMKNPGTFNLTFSGTWVHGTRGMLSDGSTAFADTGLNALSILSQFNTHMSVYTLSAQNTVGTYDMGCRDGTPVQLTLTFRQNGSSLQYGTNAGSALAGTSGNTTTGHVAGSRRANNDIEVYKDGVSQSTNTGTETGVLPNLNIYLGASNFSGSAANFVGRLYNFFTIGSGLSDAVVALMFQDIYDMNKIYMRHV